MPSAHAAEVLRVLAPATAPVAFARQDGRKMPLNDGQLAALTPCEVGLFISRGLQWTYCVHSMQLHKSSRALAYVLFRGLFPVDQTIP